jgi:hypothetical protein
LLIIPHQAAEGEVCHLLKNVMNQENGPQLSNALHNIVECSMKALPSFYATIPECYHVSALKDNIVFLLSLHHNNDV